MTLTIDIPDFLADNLAEVPAEELKQYALVGLKALAARHAGESTLTNRRADAAAVFAAHKLTSADLEKPTAGAALLKKLQAEGVLTGYGDPNEDSLDVAKRLRDSVWRSRED